MTGPEIIARTAALNLPFGSYVVFGSCPLAVAGLRESSDIDLLISEELAHDLIKTGWQHHDGVNGDMPLTYGVFDAHTNWRMSDYDPSLEQLLKTATVVQGIPFVSLAEVRIWKASLGRPKDLADIALIDNSGLLH